MPEFEVNVVTQAVSNQLPARIDYSIDLETLDTDENAVIMSVAIVAFNIETGELLHAYHQNLDVDFELATGAKINGDTLRWWAQQNHALFSEVIAGRTPNFVVAENIEEMIDIERCGGIWGNGATFDVTKLSRLCKRAEHPAPWDNNQHWPGGFRFVRDMRTLIDLARQCGFDDKAIPFEGEKHNALADACHQARVISAAWQHIKERANRD